eukprot:scaffold35947_cov63-Phaeocystis_antarctica.AAC.4
MEASVSGCRSPNDSRDTFSASRNNGSASLSFPWSSSSVRVAIFVHALAAAVGCVLLWARALPLFEAVLVDKLGGAAAGARLHERAAVFTLQAHAASLLLLLLLALLLRFARRRCRAERRAVLLRHCFGRPRPRRGPARRRCRRRRRCDTQFCPCNPYRGQ